MRTVYAIHAPQPDHLADVIDQMTRMGAPEIKVVDCGDHYMALEGSHRLAAAAHLGLEPIWVVYGQDDVLDVRQYDWYDEANWADTAYTAGEVAGELYSVQAHAYRFGA